MSRMVSVCRSGSMRDGWPLSSHSGQVHDVFKLEVAVRHSCLACRQYM